MRWEVIHGINQKQDKAQEASWRERQRVFAYEKATRNLEIVQYHRANGDDAVKLFNQNAQIGTECWGYEN